MKRRKVGFTLAEVLVSIAVLTIAISGVLAALAYDAFSAEQGGNYTYALNYSRRVLDLLQSNQLDPLTPGFMGTTLADPNTPGPNDNVNWRDLDNGLLQGGAVINLWGAPGSVERQRFDIEKNRYGVNLVARRLKKTVTVGDVATNYQNQLVELTVTTRWKARRGFRFVRLRGFYVTSPKDEP
ncbi:MAG: prepilin-type N-terminal cleavage/methylation domain-containing protein [Candidatus Eremiobacteraeota bacterium]|nr:prepilin-type N-terminal cleavage/methylation domain-containing protein [Candidatus Eremiobacteraeota bacterium]MCW5868971.1 prepilin-type N-terminal cleavage/methylation domain-containing protein [Candidatus Eremiobacteraeota bacterium]